VKELSKEGRNRIEVVDVDHDRAVDSWFVGYYWSPLIVHTGDGGDGRNGDYQHVGWKFTAVDDTDDNNNNQNLRHFYALMVETKDPREEQESVGIRLHGFKAPGWIANRIVS
jgi:hypothetical protein